jgi:hypothetical protein
MLREGAFSVMMDDDAAVDEFTELDIDKLLQLRSHTLITEGGQGTDSWLNKRKELKMKKSTFTSANAQSDIDINDPDFWKKVGLSSPPLHWALSERCF